VREKVNFNASNDIRKDAYGGNAASRSRCSLSRPSTSGLFQTPSSCPPVCSSA